MADKKKDSKKKVDKEDAMSKAVRGLKSDQSRADKMASIFEAGSKVHGKNFLSLASKSEATVVPRVSFGILSLDIDTNGGVPLGRTIMVMGDESTGKTNLFLRTLGNVQRLCANCFQEGEFKSGKLELWDLEKPGKTKIVKTQVITDCPCGKPRDFLATWIDAERSWFPEWSETLGVWSEKVILMRPHYAEQSYDFICALIESGTIDGVVIDSIAAMTPQDEIVNSVSAQGQGVAARVNNKFIRKMVSGQNKCFQQTGTCPSIWMINQYRKKIGVMFGPDDVLPGGKGQLFVATTQIECRKGKVTLDSNDSPLEALFKYTVKKNKVGPGGGKGEYSMCQAQTDYNNVGDILECDAVIDMAVDIGYITRPTKMTYRFEGQEFRGKGQLEIYFIENGSTYKKLKSKILAVKLGYEE